MTEEALTRAVNFNQHIQAPCCYLPDGASPCLLVLHLACWRCCPPVAARPLLPARCCPLVAARSLRSTGCCSSAARRLSSNWLYLAVADG